MKPLKVLVHNFNIASVTDGIFSIETFIMSFDKYMGVFDSNYTGGDFCAGLTFGM